ncbi:hypothetical protein RFI_21007 [Reticulomyxa filosa]|uniref:Haem-binding uptake Tiki superfamily ChaN domain-containing protein n=1 Tax=Reticulomyxa filosa TaxID=46433 RepID=X6MSC5_RETFI|nr:hypothetical protein RFI_21007 [Reticulomyxa filosa]|eukprot:ETO16347.1 hypothetical protein RFI_21007 [Reticulomyxa filosa]
MKQLSKLFQVSSKKNLTCISSEVLSKSIVGPKVLYFGEIHHNTDVLNCQLELLHSLCENKSKATKIAVVMEMFNLNHQELLNRYMQSGCDSKDDNSKSDKEPMSLESFQKEYDIIGPKEGFKIAGHYGAILQMCRKNGIDVLAGFPPRETASQLVSLIKSKDESFTTQVHKLLKATPLCLDLEQSSIYESLIFGKDWNYCRYFYYLLTQEYLAEQASEATMQMAMDKFKTIFPAQCFKDTIMAKTIVANYHKYDHIVVIAGKGHLDLGFGVPIRVQRLITEQDISTHKHTASKDDIKSSSTQDIPTLIFTTATAQEWENHPFKTQTLADFVVLI